MPKPGRGGPRFLRVRGKGAWIVVAAVCLFFVTGFVAERSLCPGDSFEVSNQGTVVSLVIAGLAACSLGVAAARAAAGSGLQAEGAGVRRQPGIGPALHHLPLLTLLVVTGLAGANHFLRYACFGPGGIALHLDPLEPMRVAGWERVARVEESCWRSKGSRHASLAFGLVTGERVLMELGNDAATMERVTAALRGREVAYAADGSVSADNCPADVYAGLRRRGG